MTRKEAFDISREDWKKEDEDFKTAGAYSFQTETARWLANLEQIESFTNRVIRQLENLKAGISRDRSILSHFALDNSETNSRFGMESIDRKGAERLLSILVYTTNALDEATRDARKD